MRLSLLLFFCLHGICWTKYTCVYQPKVLYVKEGESVTIPCSYTYPDYYRRKSQIIVTWGKAEGRYCSKITKNITDPSGNIVDDEYKDRISVVNNPENRTGSITIRGLKATDGVTFCCIETVYTTTSTAFSWFDIYGTTLTFADGKSLSQMEELIAVPGEEMVVPCHHPLKTPEKVTKVTWYIGNYTACIGNNKMISTWPPAPDITDDESRYSLVNVSEDFSLRIHRVQSSAQSHYCCRVTYSSGRYIESRYGTELTIADPPSSAPFNVTQLYNITGHRGESVTLSCSYSPCMENDVLWVDIYWRAGNISGPYVYHPYKEMVHPNYRGRTGIIRAADLHIRGLEMSDTSMYYCFVMIRPCTGSIDHEKIIQYGNGTRLIVTESSESQSDTDDLSRVIIISISAAIFLALLCLVIIILKITGVICKKKNGSEKTKMENEKLPLEERPYCELSPKTKENNKTESEEEKDEPRKREREEEENENVLYSEINKSKLQQRNPTSTQIPEEQVVQEDVPSCGLSL
ncbi:uncharacterized protein [Engystomops pustulosus]|uniref:uncharacterized protein n=1 Tax=Engystomops pustulosus TaxID=76066 RepID=UPI003AFA7130